MGLASSGGGRWTLLLLCLACCSCLAACQKAIPPTGTVQPLYACSMELEDLPQFTGSPTPEMLAGGIGLTLGLQGLTGGPSAAGAGSGAARDRQQAAEPSVRPRRPPRPHRVPAAVAAPGQVAGKLLPQSLQPQRSSRSIHADSAAAQGSSGMSSRRQQATVAATPGGSNWAGQLFVRGGAGSSSGTASGAVAATPITQAGGRRQHQHQQQQQQRDMTGRHLLQAGPATAAEPAAAAVDGDSSEQVYLHSTDLFDAESLLDKQFCLNKGASPLKHHQHAASSSAVQGPAQPVAAASANSSAASLAAAAAAMDAVAGIADISTAAKHRGRKTQAGASGWPSLPKLGSLLKKAPGAVKAGLAHRGGGVNEAPRGDASSYEQPAEPPAYEAEPRPPHHYSYEGPARLSGFKPAWRQEGLCLDESGNVPADATVAVGPFNLLHVVNSLVKIVPLEHEDSAPGGPATVVGLPDFFSLVASNCDGGYITPSAAYDKQVGRFLLTAVCGGDANQILLAVSQGADAAGAWWLYSFPGYSTVDTPMECIDDAGEQANPFSIHTQVGYNRDGVFVSFVQNCPLEGATGATGAVVYALPKWSLYSGATQNVIGPVFTAYDVLQAVGQYNDFDLEAASFRQLQPAMPQRPEDVQADLTYFVNDPLTSSTRNQLAVVALVNTGSLWQYTGEDDPPPLLVARVVGRGVDCSIDPSTLLQQPAVGDADAPVGRQEGMCAPLDPGAAHPPGFWSGGAALYGNSIFVADRGPDLTASSSSPATTFPSVYWAVLSPSLCATGTCATFLGDDWGWDEGWDWGSGRWEDNGGSKEAHQWQRQRFFRVRAAKKRPQGYAAAAAAPPADSSAVAGGAAAPVMTAGPVAAAAAALPAMAAATAGRRLQAEVAAVALAPKPKQAPKPKPLSAAFKAAAAAAPAPATAAVPASPPSAAAVVAGGDAAGATTLAGALPAPVAAAVSGAARSSRPDPYQRRSPFLPPAGRRGSRYGDDDDEDYDDGDDAFAEEGDSDDEEDEAYGGASRGDQRPYSQPPRPYIPPQEPYSPPKPQPYIQQHEEPGDGPRGAPPMDRVYYGADDQYEDDGGPDGPPHNHTGYGQPDHPPPAYGSSPKPRPSPSPSPSPSPASDEPPPQPSPSPVPPSPPPPTMHWPSPPPPRPPRPYRPPAPPFSPPPYHAAPPDGYDGEPGSGTGGQPQHHHPSKHGGKHGAKDSHHRQQQQQQQQHGKDKGGGKRLGAFSLAKPAQPTVWEVMMRACNRPAESSAPASHTEYYEAWRDNPGVRHVYAKLHLAPRYNPCKYYRDWHVDNRITFGVIVSRRGVLDHATGPSLAGNAVGLAFPQVVVRDGSALLVYSFSGPGGTPGATDLPAYPGIGYSIIPPGLAGGSAAFNLLKAGAGCVYQGPVPGREQQAWGSYSGADIHVPSLTAWTAVGYAQHKSDLTSIPSNAGTWLQAFVPAHVSDSYNPYYTSSYSAPPDTGSSSQQQQSEDTSYADGAPEQYEHDGEGSGSSSSDAFYDDGADQLQVLPHPIGLHGHSGSGLKHESSWAHEALEDDAEGSAWDEEDGTHGSTTGASIQRWAPEDADGTAAGTPSATAQPQAASSPSPASKPQADDMLAKVRMWLSQATQQQQAPSSEPAAAAGSGTVSTQPSRAQQPGQAAALLQALVKPLQQQQQQQQPGSSKQSAAQARKQHGRQAGHSASRPGQQVGASADTVAAAAASSNQAASPQAVQLPMVPLLARLSGALQLPAPNPDGGQQQGQQQQQAQLYYDDYEAHS